MTANDRFCLDGQRLVTVGTTNYWTPNAEYRTEIESFTRIRAVQGSSVNGPAYFTVETADGRIHEYGATNDSRIDGAPGPSTNGARTWALNRIRAAPVTSSTTATTRSRSAPPFASPVSSTTRILRAGSQRHTRSRSPTRTGPTRRSTRASRRGWHCGRSCASSASTSAMTARCCGAMSSPTSPCSHPAGAAASPRSASAARAEAIALRRQASNGRTALRGTSACQSRSRPRSRCRWLSPHEQAWNLADINGDGRNDILWAGGADAASLTIRYRLSVADRRVRARSQHGYSLPIRHRRAIRRQRRRSR